ncbi:DUF5710 domain-containing protein [Crenobacter sp. SG2303]|uniref:DUF5710 domain-containing protein n=2 Tax=Crenobacter oryzisoli TaxID=3056844 RepID=A0ABT7XRK5_9NEIS|nr:DUF5710 domain-containing protein [Crenobacter sp. SG2303]MDN0076423.1 DUF5710 domain-containing protein [Crenobacter sp. SG2303]
MANKDSKLYLNVPFAEKDSAKALGARWFPAMKKWYVPHELDLNLFIKWWPDDLRAAYEATAGKEMPKTEKPERKPRQPRPPRVKLDYPPLKNDRSTPEIDLPWD